MSSNTDGILAMSGCLWTCAPCTSLFHMKGELKLLIIFLFVSDYLHAHQALFISDCTRFVLEHNNFQFLDTYYLQKSGIAMGAHFAACYTNLFMGFGVPTPLVNILSIMEDTLMTLLSSGGHSRYCFCFRDYCNKNP